MSDQYTPSGGQTIFPRVNFLKTFESRFAQRVANGRVFGASGSPTPPTPDPLAIAGGQGANWVGSNVYEVGQTVEAKTAAYAGGVEPVTYRYRFQFKPTGESSFVNGPWTNTTNAKNSATYLLTETGEVKFQSQASDSSDPVDIVSSSTGVMTVVAAPVDTTIGNLLFSLNGVGINPNDVQDVETNKSSTISVLITGNAAASYSWSVKTGQGTITGTGASIDFTGTANGTCRISVLVTAPNATDSPKEQSLLFLSSPAPPPPEGVALELNFANSRSLIDSISGNNLVTFTRASAGTYVGSDGLIKTAVADEPRFDHDPVTGKSLGLLIEGGRTNSIKYSSDLSQSYWIKVRTTATAVQESNPFNYTDVYRVRATEDLTHDLKPNVNNFTANTTQTFSAFAAADGTGADAGLVQLRIYNLGPSSAIVNFDLITGTANTPGGLSGTTGGGHTWTISDHGLEPYGNGWYRVWMTAQISSVGTPAFVCIDNINAGDAGGVYAYTASETGGFLVAGIQLEAGSFKTSVIPTNGSTVTRSPDITTIEGADFSSWYNQSEGTFYAQGSELLGTSSPRVFVAASGSATRTVDVFKDTGPSRAISLESETTLLTSYNDYTEPYVLTAAYKADDYAGSLNGVLAFTGVAGSVPTCDRLVIGNSYTASRYANGHISRLAYFPTRKTDQDLIKLTDGTLAPAIITYGITSAGGTFNLLSIDTVDYAVDWDSTGGYETSTSNTLAHTYTAGDYSAVVYSDDAYRPYFNSITADADQITSVAIGSGADLGTDLTAAWWGASNMTTFACPFDVTSSVTSFYRAWNNCTSLASFPLLDTSSGVDFDRAWYNCTSLSSFPLLNTSSGTNFYRAWRDCNSLTSFPANMFDTTGTLVANAFDAAWLNCALTAQSIENILVSLDTNGATGITLTISGGTNAAKTTWSAAAVTAYDNLVVKGWTISFNA